MDIIEEWKELKKEYLLSSLGRVKRWRGNKAHYVKSFLDNKGYNFITLCTDGKKKSYSLGKLLAETFIGECPPKHCLGFRDGDISNISLDNIYWKNRSEYMKERLTNQLTLF